MNRQKLLPPFWFLLSIFTMIGLHFQLPIKQLFFLPINYLGILAVASGMIVVIACAFLFRQKQTTIVPFQESNYLVQEGLFNYSRNPIYLGMIITLIGIWIILGSLTPALIIPVFAWLIQEMFIKEEEKMLEEKFGELYQKYQTNVRRWI